jgi:hypothetical protein
VTARGGDLQGALGDFLPFYLFQVPRARLLPAAAGSGPSCP